MILQLFPHLAVNQCHAVIDFPDLSIDIVLYLCSIVCKTVKTGMKCPGKFELQQVFMLQLLDQLDGGILRLRQI